MSPVFRVLALLLVATAVLFNIIASLFAPKQQEEAEGKVVRMAAYDWLAGGISATALVGSDVLTALAVTAGPG